MPTSPRHGFQKWSSGFTQSDVILNADIDMLDVRLGLSVRSRTENAPLGGDAAGDCYIITGTPSGAFSAFTEDYVAYYDGTTWYEFAPIQGQVAWVDDDSEGVTFDGAGWVVTSADLSGYATEAYVNAALVGLVDLKGDYDADTNTPDLDTSPSGIFKGDAWECSVAGTFFTFELDVGDIIVAKQDDPTTEAHWIINKEAGGSGGGLDEAAVDARVVAVASGAEEMWVPVDMMWPAAPGSSWGPCANHATSELQNFFTQARYLAFDGNSAEVAYFNAAMPKRWNRGTVQFQAYWLASSTATGTVRWGLGGRAMSDDDARGTFTIVYSEDNANGTQYDLHIGPLSAAVTVQGSPAAGDMTQFLAIRDAGVDTNNVDQWLLGYKLFWTSSAPTDV